MSQATAAPDGAESNSAEVSRVIGNIVIPPCPRIVLAMVQEARSDNPDFLKLDKLISGDMGLASAVIKTANSPYYGLNHKVLAVKSALHVLGLGSVTNIVTLLALRNALSTPGQDADPFWDQFWDRTNYHAIACARLARQLRFISMDGAYTFGVSIMTEGVSLLLMDLGGNIRAHREDIMDIDDRPAIIEHVRKQLSAMAQAAQIRSDRIFGAGVAASGYFVGPGEVNAPDPLKNWSLLNLEDELSAALELPVWVENNGSAAAVGESLYGAGRRYRSFAYIYMAVGVGGGVIADGRLIRGARGNAGEFTGVLPEEARANRPTMNLLLEILQARGVAVTSIDDMTKRFDPEWPGVETWLERTRPAFTAILSAIGAVTDPDVIVLGGRIPPALARLMAERAEFFQGRRRDREREFPLVIPAEVESDAAALGAAALPFKQHFFL